MVQNGKGSILNVASIAAFQAGPLMAVYYASKAYVLNFSLALTEELRGTGVTVTCLCPGPTATGFEAGANLSSSKLFKTHLMDAPTVAHIGYSAMLKGTPLIVAGVQNKIAVFLTRLLPRTIAAKIAKYIQSPL
jgi:short-subunit dehydrogenase